MSRNSPGLSVAAAALALLCVAAQAGTSCRDGVATAVPAPPTPVTVDGDLSDWDLSAPVLSWNAEETADEENCTLFFMHDDEALYVAYDMALPGGRMPENANRPQDRYWRGDVVQLRLCTDPALGWPLPDRRDQRLANTPAVTTVNLWRDTAAGVDYCHVTPGAMFDCEAATNPGGSAVATVSAAGRLVLEARVPWAALGAPGGRRPVAPGGRIPAVVDVKWSPGTDGHATAAVFAKDPGVFAFMNLHTWGRLELAARPGSRPAARASGEAAALADQYAAIAAAARVGAAAPDTSGWAKIAFDLPRRAKVSVNIFDERGGVVRELIGGEWRDAGRVEVRWDGRDFLGFPCETGRDWRWGAYAHDGLDVVYEGTVGVSGDPPYGTPDGTGGWGADHGPPVACAADDTGRYFAWHKSEQGCALVKTGFDGKVLWRANPFVRGGWGEYTAACADGGALWLVHGAANGKMKAALVKIDAATGRHELFPDGRPFVELPADATATNLPAMSAARPEFGFNCAGIAAKGGAVYVSDRNGNRVLVVDAGTGEVVGEIPCDSPRGLAFAPDGALWAVSGKSVVRFELDETRQSTRDTPDTGCQNVETLSPASRAACRLSGKISGLCAPYALAIGPDGTLYVIDLGESQQIKVYEGAASGRAALRNAAPTKVFGKRGGRGFLGAIDYGAFLFPFGLAIDKTGALLVAEASAPKIVSVLDAATGAVVRRYFGYSAYSPTNIPDCDDPRLQLYSLSGPDAFARQRIGSAPEAVWDFAGAGMGVFGRPCDTMQAPRVFRASDGCKYLVPDAFSPAADGLFCATMFRMEGDAMVPVASVLSGKPAEKGSPCIVSVWTDANGDGVRQDSETAGLPATIGGRAFSFPVGMTPVPGTLFVDDAGNLFLTARENAVIGVPCRGFERGAPRWDAAAAYVAIPEIAPGEKMLPVTHRMGLRGLWRDGAGNFYGSVAYTPRYASPDLQKHMSTGMGHTALVGGVFVCKWAPDGSLLWRAGRKAPGGLRPGEMLGHWNHAGMIGDGYTVAGSEWGVFTVYTSDGFFVDSLFDPPGVPGRGAPYSFGGEDFSGRVRFFPEHGEVWAYNSGHAFRVEGFEFSRKNRKESVEMGAAAVRSGGERQINGGFPAAASELPEIRLAARASGTAAASELTEIRPAARASGTAAALADPRVAGEWRTNGVVRLERVAPLFVPGAKPKPLERVKLERVGGKLVFTAHVVDDTPLVNVATGAESVFKGGDAVGFEIGPGKKMPANMAFTRILAARIGGKDRVIALQHGGTRLSRPQSYTTPAGGTAAFSFVGDVPGASVAFAPDADGGGYSARIEVPDEFLELDFAKPVFWDAEALFSGDTARGPGTARRVYLHNPETSATSMVDDAPTEARLRPEGYVEIALGEVRE